MTKLVLVIALAACAGESSEEFPVEPGSLPGGGGTGGGGTAILAGRICVSEDLQDLAACRTEDLAGFMVELGDQLAVTDDAGNFFMPMPRGSLLSFTVTGPNAITSTTPFSPSLTVPVIDAVAWARAASSNEIFAIEGAGSVLGTVVRGVDVEPSGIIVTSDPTGSFTPLFDADGNLFGTDATGARGVFWLNGITAGGTNLTLRDLVTGGVTTVGGVQVINGGVTILDSVVLR